MHKIYKTPEWQSLLTNIAQNNPLLTTIDLKGNEIDDIGLIELSQALKNNHTLTSIDLSNNKITTKGIKNLEECTANNNKLLNIRIRGNCIEDSSNYLSNTICFTNPRLAINICSNLISEDPYNSLAYYHRGLAKCQLEKYKSAYKDFSAASIINPNDVDAIYNKIFIKSVNDLFVGSLGKFFVSLMDSNIQVDIQGLYQELVLDLQQILKIQPGDSYAYLLLAYVYYAIGDLKSALKYVTNSIQINPNVKNKEVEEFIQTVKKELSEESFLKFPSLNAITTVLQPKHIWEFAKEYLDPNQLADTVSALTAQLSDNIFTFYKGNLSTLDKLLISPLYKKLLNENEIDYFLKDYASKNKLNKKDTSIPDWTNWKTYKLYLTILNPLNKLAQYPFFLKNLIELLPKVITKSDKYTLEELEDKKTDICNLLVKKWFEFISNKIMQDTLSSNIVLWSALKGDSLPNTLSKEDYSKIISCYLKKCIKRYNKRLALTKLKQVKKDNSKYLGAEDTLEPNLFTPNYSKEYLFQTPPENEVMKIFRDYSLLREKNKSYKFINNSLINVLTKDESNRGHIVIDQKQTSQIESDLPIEYDNWVVSIVRNTKSLYPEHVYIIVEGMNGYGKIILHRYDLVTNDAGKDNKARIRITKKEVCEPQNHKDKIEKIIWDKSCGNSEIDMSAIRHLSWRITRDMAKDLHKDIEQDRFKNHDFRLFYGSLYSGKDSENCLIWARKKLLKLGDKNIDRDLHKGKNDPLISIPKLEVYKYPSPEAPTPNYLQRLFHK